MASSDLYWPRTQRRMEVMVIKYIHRPHYLCAYYGFHENSSNRLDATYTHSFSLELLPNNLSNELHVEAAYKCYTCRCQIYLHWNQANEVRDWKLKLQWTLLSKFIFKNSKLSFLTSINKHYNDKIHCKLLKMSENTENGYRYVLHRRKPTVDFVFYLSPVGILFNITNCHILRCEYRYLKWKFILCFRN